MPNKKQSLKGKPCRIAQNRRTFAHVQKRRKLHQMTSPNETESLARAKRWVSPP